MATGYNVYRGVGGIGTVDFTTVLAVLAQGATSATLVGLGHAVSTRYTYVVRPFLDDLETPDYSNAVEFQTDGAGEWLGVVPMPVEYVTAYPLSGAQVTVEWTWRTEPGEDAPADFGVYHSTSVPITPGVPDSVVTYTRDGRYTHTFSLVDGVSYFFIVTARNAAAVESRASNTAGPVLADDTAPDTPIAIVSSSF